MWPKELNDDIGLATTAREEELYAGRGFLALRTSGLTVPQRAVLLTMALGKRFGDPAIFDYRNRATTEVARLTNLTEIEVRQATITLEHLDCFNNEPSPTSMSEPLRMGALTDRGRKFLGW